MPLVATLVYLASTCAPNATLSVGGGVVTIAAIVSAARMSAPSRMLRRIALLFAALVPIAMVGGVVAFGVAFGRCFTF